VLENPGAEERRITGLPRTGVRCGDRTVVVVHADRRDVFQYCDRRDLWFAATVHVGANLLFVKKKEKQPSGPRERKGRGEEGGGGEGRKRGGGRRAGEDSAGATFCLATLPFAQPHNLIIEKGLAQVGEETTWFLWIFRLG